MQFRSTVADSNYFGDFSNISQGVAVVANRSCKPNRVAIVTESRRITSCCPPPSGVGNLIGRRVLKRTARVLFECGLG